MAINVWFWYRNELADAVRGVPPVARKCATTGELADWFALFAIAAGARI